MAEQQQLTHGGSSHQVSGTTVLLASLAGVALGGPLVSMMGFTFVATVTLLLISSPLLIISSPLMFGAALVICAALAGFAAAAAMALVGTSSFAWLLRSFRGRRFDGGATDIFIESGESAKDYGKDLIDYLQQNPHERED